jgi:hypothetical protein
MDPAGVAALLFVVVFLLALYYLPTLAALARHKRDALAIGALNTFLGWSLIGWVVALVWALRVDD